MKISLGQGNFDNTPRQVEFESFRDLLDLLARADADRSPGKHGDWLSCAFRKGPHSDAAKYPYEAHFRLKSATDLSGWTIACLDFDTITPAEYAGIQNALCFTYNAMLYHTASWSAEKPKCRVVIELDRAPASLEEYREVMAALTHRLGGMSDRATWYAGQPIYMPTQGAHIEESEGTPASVDELLAEYKRLRAEDKIGDAQIGAGSSVDGARSQAQAEDLLTPDTILSTASGDFSVVDLRDAVRNGDVDMDASGHRGVRCDTPWRDSASGQSGVFIVKCDGSCFVHDNQMGEIIPNSALQALLTPAAQTEDFEGFSADERTLLEVKLAEIESSTDLMSDAAKMLIDCAPLVRAKLEQVIAEKLGVSKLAVSREVKALESARSLARATKHSGDAFPDMTDKGVLLPTSANAVFLAETTMDLCYDTFLDKPMLDGQVLDTSRGDHRTQLRLRAEAPGLRVPDKVLFDAIEHVARTKEFDSLMVEWKSLPAWDGVKRLDTVIHDYFGAEQSEYTAAVGHYLFTVMAGRALVPGVKADSVVALVGDQGLYKSSVIKALAGTKDRYGELIRKHLTNADELARFIKHKTVVEFSEFAGVSVISPEDMRALITRTEDEERPMGANDTRQHPRRCVLVGSLNPVEGEGFLKDVTGNRRMLPVDVTRACDAPGLLANIDQLKAEGLQEFLATGDVAWKALEPLRAAAQAAHVASRKWEDAVCDFLRPYEDAGYVSWKNVADHFDLTRRGSQEIVSEFAMQGWKKVKVTARGPFRLKVLFCKDGIIPTKPAHSDIDFD